MKGRRARRAETRLACTSTPAWTRSGTITAKSMLPWLCLARSCSSVLPSLAVRLASAPSETRCVIIFAACHSFSKHCPGP